MYFTSLPNHTAAGFDEQAHFNRFRKQNIIFNAFSRQSHCDKHVGCLSFKTILSGEEWYGIDNREVAVRSGQFLILNDDQVYSCRIPQGIDTKVLSVFFQKEFAISVFQDLHRSEDALLDDPWSAGSQIPEFFQTLHAIEPNLASRLSSLMAALDTFGYDRSRTDEYLVFLLQHLLRTYRSETCMLMQVKAIKPSTQKEIFKRLCVVKDILHSSFQESIDLSWLSEQACLSMPQLIRQFKSVYRQTPYQYLIAIRLHHAAQWLNETTMPVQEITWRCGFEDASAFCRAFRVRYGLSPERFRSL
jgi:AraC-like DNA-binding protein